jgi:hypothetical protein
MSSQCFSVGITDSRKLKNKKEGTNFNENRLGGSKVTIGHRHI